MSKVFRNVLIGGAALAGAAGAAVWAVAPRGFKNKPCRTCGMRIVVCTTPVPA